jgi:hypothetical protein
MLNGVPLYNGFDAHMRDAPAHEMQDICNGHPDINGVYHYHNLSACFRDIDAKTIIGIALDGFPITGPVLSNGHYLTTQDLDACHGLTSAITVNGQSYVTYHYVMTRDFPYSVSCFRSKPSRVGPLPVTYIGDVTGANMLGGPNHPPQEAVAVCAQSGDQAPCSFTDSATGEAVKGICHLPPGFTALACIPTPTPQAQPGSPPVQSVEPPVQPADPQMQ